jgi:hypothetical protein
MNSKPRGRPCDGDDRHRLVLDQGDAGGKPPGDEFAGWRDGWYWQRRELGAIEDGFGKPAGEPHGPFRTEAKARVDLLLEYRRRAEEQLGK